MSSRIFGIFQGLLRYLLLAHFAKKIILFLNFKTFLNLKDSE